MGWLGWTYDVALATDVLMIEWALESRSDLLSMIFGSGTKGRDKPGKKGDFASRFKKFAGQVNRRAKKGDG